MKPHRTLKSFGELSIEKLLLANPDPLSTTTAKNSSRAAASFRRAPAVTGNSVEKSGLVHRLEADRNPGLWINENLNN